MEQHIRVYLDESFNIDGLDVTLHALNNGRGILMVEDEDDGALVNIKAGGHILPENGKTHIHVIAVNADNVLLGLTRMAIQ